MIWGEFSTFEVSEGTTPACRLIKRIKKSFTGEASAQAKLVKDFCFMTYQEQLNTPEWKAKALEIKERDCFTCRKCLTTQHLQVHHHRYIDGLMAWEYPNYMLITLCALCHSEHHGKDVKYHRGETISLREGMLRYITMLQNGQKIH